MGTPLDIALVPPTVALRDSFLEGMAAFQAEDLPWWSGGDLDLAVRDFAAFVDKKLGDARPAASGDASETGADLAARIPKTHRWAVANGVFVGRVHLHHALDDGLRREGGHIGYDTVPAWRGRGVAREMLRGMLPLAKALGLDEVRLTTDDTNAASIRVIESCGGVLVDRLALAADRPLKRYYRIALR